MNPPLSGIHPLVKRVAEHLLEPFLRMGFDVTRLIGFLTEVPRKWNRPFDRLDLHGVGAEIGVYRGMHAKHMLRLHPDISTLWLVDAYQPYSVEGGLCPDLPGAREVAHRVMQKHRKRIRWLQVGSPDCARMLPDLDFCYIDADHSYKSMVVDLEAMWPKVKSGGIFGGHDFVYTFPGLNRAVVEFVVRHNVDLKVDSPDWWVIKS